MLRKASVFNLKKSILLFISLFIFWTKRSLAQENLSFTASPITETLGSYAVEENSFSSLNNLAGTANIQDIYINTAFKIPHEMLSLSESSLSILYPTNFGVLNFGFYRYGNKHYNEQNLSTGFANKIDRVSFGLQVNYLQFSQIHKKSYHKLNFNLSGIIRLNEKISIGTSIRNVLASKIKAENGDKIPLASLMSLAIAYQISQQFILSFQTESNSLSKKLKISGGLRFDFMQHFYAATGFQTNPFKTLYGLGIRINKKIGIEYALSFHNSLGASHHFGAYYKIPKK